MRFHYCLLVGACLAAVFSCKEKPAEPEEAAPKVELPAGTQALFDKGVSVEAGEPGSPSVFTLRFTTNKPWKITVAETKAVSWMTVSPDSGPAGEAVVEVTVAPNPSGEARSATLTLSCGELDRKLAITQEGKPETPPVPVEVKSVSLSPESLELLVGESASLTYSVTPEDADIESVTWSSSDSSVATVSEGKVTAVAAGEALVSVKVNGVEARCSVTVETPFIPVESITISMKEISLLEGTDYQLTATVLPENATDPSVSWTSSDESVATVENGLVKALREGTAVITAKAGEKEDRCAVTVEKDFVPVSSITLSPQLAELLPGESLVLTATVLPEDATDPSVQWSSSDENVAVVSEGTVTAVAPGSAVITARAGNEEARCSILVETPFVAVASITLAPSEICLVEGEETSLTATVLPENATDPHVDFTISDESVALVDGGGRVKAVAPGTAVITAAAGDCTAECRVTVEARFIPVESVSLNRQTLTLEIGQSYELAATVHPDNATEPSVSWTSSQPSVVSVSGGHVEALAAGTAVVTARAGEVEARCEITVNKPYVEVKSITLDRTELALAKGASFTLTATVLPADATEPEVVWISGNTRVATVDSQGTVTAVRVGTTAITARAGQYTATCTVTVTAALESISLNYASSTLRPYETLQLKVNPKPSDAALGEVVWTSSAPQVATVDESGLVQALKTGSATITAVMGDFQATCQLTVSENVSGGHEGTGTEVWD